MRRGSIGGTAPALRGGASFSVLAAVLLVAATAHAQGAGCEQDWHCWETLYTAPATILGVATTLTHVEHGDGVEYGFATTYSTETYTTRGLVSGHFAAFASLGAGSAGNQGSLGGTLDFGLRAAVTEHSGPLVRFGADAMLLGHEQLYVSMLEPMQGRIGYQLLDADVLLEGGLTTGYVPTGRYEPGDGTRDLSDTPEIGVYGAAHLRLFRFDARFTHLPADSTAPRTAVNLFRAALCSYPRPIALCTDLLYVHGDAQFGSAGARATSALYAGFTLGVTP